MIVAVGIDVVLVDRFIKALARTPLLADRLFTEAERHTVSGNPRSAESLAARFAAKEAVAKALGAPVGLHWHDCEIVTDPDGRPWLTVAGTVAAVAKERGVKEPGIARLRKAVQDLRNPVPSGSGNVSAEVPLEPALLVVIEPHDDRTGAPPYRLHFYRWEPWETEELMRVTGTAGRGICVRDPSPYIELEHLKGELSTALGALLREIQPERQCVEFVVPGRLLCEPFEHIKVDLWGDVLGLTLDPEELGVVARVVVRSWERTHTKFPPQLCEQWRRRWRHVRPPVLRACQLDPSSDAFALLQLNENREVSFLWVAFAPVCPVASQKILGGLLKGGVPISLWRREEWCGTDANAVGEALAKLVDTLEPADLRDRVQDLRVQAVNAAACPHIGKSLTLFWDDPDRVPPQAKSVPSPLR